jgi:hypothetical protein
MTDCVCYKIRNPRRYSTSSAYEESQAVRLERFPSTGGYLHGISFKTYIWRSLDVSIFEIKQRGRACVFFKGMFSVRPRLTKSLVTKCFLERTRLSLFAILQYHFSKFCSYASLLTRHSMMARFKAISLDLLPPDSKGLSARVTECTPNRPYGIR